MLHFDFALLTEQFVGANVHLEQTKTNSLRRCNIICSKDQGGPYEHQDEFQNSHSDSAVQTYGHRLFRLRCNEEGPCSNRTLQGSYSFTIEGMILAIPGAPALPAPLPLRAVALTTFDGKGNLDQVDHYVVAGGPPTQDWQPSSGTYTVNANCTGIMTLVVPGNPLSPFVSYFILSKRGTEIRTVLNANLVSSVGVLVDQPSKMFGLLS